MWLEEVVQAAKAGSLRTGPLHFADRVFQNDLYMAIQQTHQVCYTHLPDTLCEGYLLTVFTGVHSYFASLPGKLEVKELFLLLSGCRSCAAERTLFAYAMTCGHT